MTEVTPRRYFQANFDCNSVSSVFKTGVLSSCMRNMQCPADQQQAHMSVMMSPTSRIQSKCCWHFSWNVFLDIVFE